MVWEKNENGQPNKACKTLLHTHKNNQTQGTRLKVSNHQLQNKDQRKNYLEKFRLQSSNISFFSRYLWVFESAYDHSQDNLHHLTAFRC